MTRVWSEEYVLDSSSLFFGSWCCSPLSSVKPPGLATAGNLETTRATTQKSRWMPPTRVAFMPNNCKYIIFTFPSPSPIIPVSSPSPPDAFYSRPSWFWKDSHSAPGPGTFLPPHSGTKLLRLPHRMGRNPPIDGVSGKEGPGRMDDDAFQCSPSLNARASVVVVEKFLLFIVGRYLSTTTIASRSKGSSSLHPWAHNVMRSTPTTLSRQPSKEWLNCHATVASFRVQVSSFSTPRKVSANCRDSGHFDHLCHPLQYCSGSKMLSVHTIRLPPANTKPPSRLLVAHLPNAGSPRNHPKRHSPRRSVNERGCKLENRAGPRVEGELAS